MGDELLARFPLRRSGDFAGLDWAESCFQVSLSLGEGSESSVDPLLFPIKSCHARRFTTGVLETFARLAGFGDAWLFSFPGAGSVTFGLGALNGFSRVSSAIPPSK